MDSSEPIAHAEPAFLTGTLAIILIFIILFFIVKCFTKDRQRGNTLQLGKSKNCEKGIAKQRAQTAVSVVGSPQRGQSLLGVRCRCGGNNPLFSWASNPSLVTDAVESGWVRFAFRPTTSIGIGAAGESSSSASDTEFSWELGQASNEFMQKIRLNLGMKVSWIRSDLNSSVPSVIQTALPLPGPACAFPREAYFEIIVLSCREEDENHINIMEGQHIHGSSDLNISATSVTDDARSESGVGSILAVGLTMGGNLPMKLPGSYPGSIGLVSNGSLHYDGNMLVSKLDKRHWGLLKGKVIGCGFDPSQKKVIFTVDAELVHTVTCSTEEFSAPLYPTVSANCDITLLVNNGQSPFKYEPANANRRANPCFLGNQVQCGTFEEDSKELFSMGRIDTQWNDHIAVRESVYNGNGNTQVKDYGEESDVDELFDIGLESSTTSLFIRS